MSRSSRSVEIRSFANRTGRRSGGCSKGSEGADCASGTESGTEHDNRDIATPTQIVRSSQHMNPFLTLSTCDLRLKVNHFRAAITNVRSS